MMIKVRKEEEEEEEEEENIYIEIYEKKTFAMKSFKTFCERY